jgi:hypothetical protein
MRNSGLSALPVDFIGNNCVQGQTSITIRPRTPQATSHFVVTQEQNYVAG